MRTAAFLLALSALAACNLSYDPDKVVIQGKALGASCNAGGDCASGFCDDGVCCDTARCPACHACNGTAPGTCTPVPSGQDPNGDCTAGAAACEAGGCDGSGGCLPASQGTVCSTSCVDGSCSGQVQGSQVSQGTCNGTAASCPAGGPVSCPGGYSCGGVSCKTSCSADEDCVQGFFCDIGPNTCAARLANGAGCARGSQCQSSLCDPGTGKCQSCSTGADCSPSLDTCGGNACVVDGAVNCLLASNCPVAGWGNTCSGVGGACVCNGSGQCNGRAPLCNGGTSTCACTAATGAICPVGMLCTGAGGAGTCAWRAGMPCCGNADCQSGLCSPATRTCAGAAKGMPCANNGDCASGTCTGSWTCG